MFGRLPILVVLVSVGCRARSTPSDTKGLPAVSDTSTDTGLTDGSHDSGDAPPTDLDGDGHLAEAAGGDDCDDTHPAVFPGAPEICDDGMLNDCDGDPAAAAALCGWSGTTALVDIAWLDSVGMGDGWFTYDVMSPGDANGDGQADLWVGDGDGSDGKVQLDTIALGADGWTRSRTDTWISGPAGFGAQLDSADVNSDGYADLVSSAPFDSAGATSAGSVVLFYGPFSGHVPEDNAAATILGTENRTFLGHTHTSTRSDLDNDGSVDLIVSDGADPISTRVVLNAWSDPTDPAELFFEGLENGSPDPVDFNGDGLHDLILVDHDSGRPSQPEASVHLFNGPLDAATTADDAFRITNSRDDRFVYAIPAGDLDQDGYTDLLVGAPAPDSSETRVGRAMVVPGPPAPGPLVDQVRTTVDGLARHIDGGPLAAVGDLDGDGIPEWTIQSDDEVIHLVRGAPAGTWSAEEAPATFTADDPISGVYRTGDLDLDGHDDFVVTTQWYAGASFVVDYFAVPGRGL